MVLFICHASEDKPDFVRPLAEKLRDEHEVWYDEYEITLGDSLLATINAGLRRCDFGVVVFSPAFFRPDKKWPMTELGGLFALETQNRKIILPILKDIPREEFVKLLPIMGDRVTVNASNGIERVIEEINLAVQVAERNRQFSVAASAVHRAKALDKKVRERSAASRLLQMPAGATLVSDAAQSLYRALQIDFDAISADSSELRFTTKANENAFTAEGPRRVTLQVYLRDIYVNQASTAQLIGRIFLRQRPLFGDAAMETLSEVSFRPTFQNGEEVVWINEDGQTLSGSEVVGALIHRVIDCFDKE